MKEAVTLRVYIDWPRVMITKRKSGNLNPNLLGSKIHTVSMTTVVFKVWFLD